MNSILKKGALLISIALISLSSQAQVGLKGMILESKVKSIEKISTTLIGNDYTLTPLILNDSTLFGIDAIPSDNRRVDQEEIDLLIEAFNTKFGVEFQYVTTHKNNVKLGEFVGEEKGIQYKIEIIDNDKVLLKPYQIVVSLRNKKLEKQAEEEAKAKVINDL